MQRNIMIVFENSRHRQYLCHHFPHAYHVTPCVREIMGRAPDHIIVMNGVDLSAIVDGYAPLRELLMQRLARHPDPDARLVVL